VSLSIRVVSCDEGYTVVLVNGSVDWEGHGTVPEFYWVELLKGFGFDISQYTISNEAMEEGDYYS
jgi:hypothetical protein